jgi:hypothetical protein
MQAHRLETALSGPMKRLHQLNPSCSRAVSLAFVLLGLLAFAAPANAGAVAAPSSSPLVPSQFAIADFDGDRRPDLATVQPGQSSSPDAQYWVVIQLSGGPQRTLGITGPTGGLQVTSRDANGDNFLDVVLTTAWTNRPVAVLLNDGLGNFRPSSPSAFPGAFTTSEKSWACSNDEVQDATAALLSHYQTDNFLEGRRFSPPRNVTGLLALRTSGNLLSSTVLSFLDRAPPSFAL